MSNTPLATSLVVAFTLTQGLIVGCGQNEPPPVLEIAVPADGKSAPDHHTSAIAGQEQEANEESRLSVTDEEFEAAAAALNTHRQEWNGIFNLGMGGGAADSPNKFMQVLADRPVGTLYAFLNEAPPAEASRRATALFESKLAMHRDGLAAIIDRFRNDETLRGKSWLSLDSQMDYHALCVSLFLCAAFCDGPTVLDQLDECDKVIGELLAQVPQDPDLGSPPSNLKFYATPEPLFVLNLYVFLLEQHGGLVPEDITEKLQSITGRRIPRFTQYPFRAWEQHRNATHQTPPQPGGRANDRQALLEFTVAQSSGDWGIIHDKQKQFVASVRPLVEACVKR
jgi:hypothetical protein